MDNSIPPKASPTPFTVSLLAIRAGLALKKHEKRDAFFLCVRRWGETGGRSIERVAQSDADH